MGGFSKKDFNYVDNFQNNSQENSSAPNSSSFIDKNSVNLGSDNNIETVDFDDFSSVNENDPYSVSDSGYTLDEIKDSIIELELSKEDKYIDSEII